MDTQFKPSHQQPSVRTNASADSFDFELWAAEVRPQLLAALQRRATESQPKS